MEKNLIPEKTNAFNLRLEDERGENWHKSEGVISVELPKIAFDGEWNLLWISPVRIFFTSVEAALAMVKAKETHLRVEAAEQLFSRNGRNGGYMFKGREHILTIERPCVCFSPGITECGKPAYALCEFKVKKYTMTLDGEETLCASLEDKVLRIN